jgi:hypothetical protein
VAWHEEQALGTHFPVFLWLANQSATGAMKSSGVLASVVKRMLFAFSSNAIATPEPGQSGPQSYPARRSALDEAAHIDASSAADSVLTLSLISPKYLRGGVNMHSFWHIPCSLI